MAKEAKDRKITQPEFDRMAAPLELDLIAFFKTLEEEVLRKTFDGSQTPEQMIQQIDSMFEDESGAIKV